MYALVLPETPVLTGYAIGDVKIKEETYPVDYPEFWIACADDVIPNLYWFDPSDRTIKRI